MDATTQPGNGSGSGWRSLITGVCTIAALAWAAQASALTSTGQGAFSPGATTITFEDLPGDNSTSFRARLHATFHCQLSVHRCCRRALQYLAGALGWQD